MNAYGDAYMSVQIIHCSDLHLDKNFNISNPIKAQLRKEDINNNFATIVDYAIRNKPDIFLITGDVFDRVLPSNQARVFLAKKVKELHDKGIKVFIIGGNHDVPKIRQHTALAIDILSATGLATVFSSSEKIQKQIININGKSICVSGKSYFAGLDQHNPLKNTKIPLDGDYNILMLHASLLGLDVLSTIPTMASYNPFYVDDIEQGLDYLALGHFHNYFERDYGNCKICNPGSIEKLSWAEMNEQKGFIWAELNGSNIETEFIQLNTRKMEQQEITLSTDITEINKTIEEFIYKFKDQEKIFKINIKGTITLEQYTNFRVNEIYEACKDLFFNLQIDRDELEVERYGKVFLGRVESPIEAFNKRLDMLILQAQNEEEHQFLTKVKSTGMKYLESVKE